MSITKNDGGVLREQVEFTKTVGGVLRNLKEVTECKGGVLRKIFSKVSSEWIWTAQGGASMTVSDDGLELSVSRSTNGAAAITDTISLPDCTIKGTLTAKLSASGYSGSAAFSVFNADTGESIGNIVATSTNSSTSSSTSSGSKSLDAGNYYFVLGGGGGSQTGTCGFSGTLTITIT